MQSSVLNDLAEAKRRWTEKKMFSRRRLWYMGGTIQAGMNTLM